MMPLPWLKRYRYHIGVGDTGPLFFWYRTDTKSCGIAHCHSAFIYSARSYSTYADGKDKIAITHQPWTRWYQGFGIAELWTLQSAVSYLSDNWVMNGPPADVLGRWSLWCETPIASHCSLQYDSFFVFQSATAAKATSLLNLGTDYRGVSWR